jgi:hypothetical protein
VGVLWQVIGVLILVAFCGNALLTRAWFSLPIAVAAILVEVWLMRRRPQLRADSPRRPDKGPGRPEPRPPAGAER